MNVYCHVINRLIDEISPRNSRDKDAFFITGHMWAKVFRAARLLRDETNEQKMLAHMNILLAVTEFSSEKSAKDKRYAITSLLEEAYQAIVNEPDQDRVFDKMIFLGACNEKDPFNDFTGCNIQLLEARVDQVLTSLGGLQQPDHCESQEQQDACNKQREECDRKLEEHLKDICFALSGKIPTSFAESTE